MVVGHCNNDELGVFVVAVEFDDDGGVFDEERGELKGDKFGEDVDDSDDVTDDDVVVVVRPAFEVLMGIRVGEWVKVR